MKTPVPVNKEKLIQVINLAEEKQWANRSALFSEVAAQYSGQTGQKISGALVYLRVNEWGLNLKTPKGRRGRQKSSSTHITEISSAQNSKNLTNEHQKAIDLLKKETPQRFHPLIGKIAHKSKASAVKLRCLECSNYQTPEVRKCKVISCPLWVVRPYQ